MVDEILRFAFDSTRLVVAPFGFPPRNSGSRVLAIVVILVVHVGRIL